MKLVRVLMLTLVLTGSAYAGDIQNGVAPPPQQAQAPTPTTASATTTETTPQTPTVTEIVLTVVSISGLF